MPHRRRCLFYSSAVHTLTPNVPFRVYTGVHIFSLTDRPADGWHSLRRTSVFLLAGIKKRENGSRWMTLHCMLSCFTVDVFSFLGCCFCCFQPSSGGLDSFTNHVCLSWGAGGGILTMLKDKKGETREAQATSEKERSRSKNRRVEVDGQHGRHVSELRVQKNPRLFPHLVALAGRCSSRTLHGETVPSTLYSVGL